MFGETAWTVVSDGDNDGSDGDGDGSDDFVRDCVNDSGEALDALDAGVRCLDEAVGRVCVIVVKRIRGSNKISETLD